MTRQMVMVGFLQAQNCTNLPSSWRHPDSREDSMSADYYQEIARVLEAGTVLDKSEGAIKSLQHRALASLQKQVTQD